MNDRLLSVWQGHADSKAWLLAMPGIASIFTRRRYHQITKYLHYCDESVVPSRDDASYKLYMVRMLTEHMGSRFAEEHMPHQHVAVDECMVSF